MLVRFTGINGCVTCTQTIDFSKIRAIGMLMATATDPNSYYVRLTFENGENFLCKENMSLTQAVSYRTTLEGYWLSPHGTGTTSVVVVND
jgi:hypothetical protein